ncbi:MULTISPECIES: hypothetical protein [Nocardia]|uniref:hypothetical protein n=1 Tax=Nocardia TaxID=1817 RepID=UPI000FE21895|nr:hypothetical protein [Nocardia africana]MCC3317873.1 hypothetical protein [Nocardia africana]
MPEDAWDHTTQWTTQYAAFGADDGTALRHVGIELREDGRVVAPRFSFHADRPAEKVFDHAARYIAYWFARVEDWVAVATGEDVYSREPLFAANTIGPGLLAWQHGKWRDAGMTIDTPRPALLSADLFAAILERVGENVDPPIEWQLVCNACRAHSRGDTRRTILDAATAVEVCLIEQIRLVESTTGEKFEGQRGMQYRSQWLAARHPGYQEHASLDLLRKSRNEGIHAGGIISLDDAASGLRAAIATVGALGRSRDPRAR